MTSTAHAVRRGHGAELAAHALREVDALSGATSDLQGRSVVDAETIRPLDRPVSTQPALAVLRADGEGAQDRPDASTIERRLAKLFRKNDPDNHDDWATGILRRYMTDYRLEREIDP